MSEEPDKPCGQMHCIVCGKLVSIYEGEKFTTHCSGCNTWFDVVRLSGTSWNVKVYTLK